MTETLPTIRFEILSKAQITEEGWKLIEPLCLPGVEEFHEVDAERIGRILTRRTTEYAEQRQIPLPEELALGEVAMKRISVSNMRSFMLAAGIYGRSPSAIEEAETRPGNTDSTDRVPKSLLGRFCLKHHQLFRRSLDVG